VNTRATAPANNFYPQKRERKRRRKKRIYSPNSQGSGACQGFLSEYYPK